MFGDEYYFGPEPQPYDEGLADIAGLAVADGNFIVGDGANWLAENADAARTSLGLGTGDSPSFGGLSVTGGLIAMSAYPTGVDNIFIGTEPPGIEATAEKCLAVGINALDAITTAHYNTAVGYSALTSHRIGSDNSAFGCQALYSDTTSTANTAIGAKCSYYNTTGSENTAVGVGALYHQETGNKNTAIGYGAGLGAINQSYSNNSLFGYYSGYALTTGSSNIFLGYYAASRQTTLSNLLIIDNQQRADVATEITNAILYGVMAAAPASQTLRINAALTVNGSLTVTGTGTFNNLKIEGAIPILVFKDNTDTGDSARGFQEWRDSNNVRLGFFGNSSYTHDDLVWKNESNGGHLLLETTGTGIVSSNTDFTTTGTGTFAEIITPTINSNTAQDLKLWEDLEIADNADGRSLYVYRNAATEATKYVRLFVDNNTFSWIDGESTLLLGVGGVYKFLLTSTNINIYEEMNFRNDNDAIKMGGGNDCSITYNGTNMVINPKVVGTGYLSVLGEIRSEGLIVDTTTLVVDSVNHRVGILDATPSYPLDVTGDIRLTGTLRANGTLDVDGMTYLLGGASVDGVLQAQDDFVLPDDAYGSPLAGSCYFNAATDTFYCYNGSAWVGVAMT